MYTCNKFIKNKTIKIKNVYIKTILNWYMFSMGSYLLVWDGKSMALLPTFSVKYLNSI